MEWQQAPSGCKLGIFYRKATKKLGADVRFGKIHFHRASIGSETEGMFCYDIAKILERQCGVTRSLRCSGYFLNFREESLSIPLEGVWPENFQLCNQEMKEELMSNILKLAQGAAQKFEQSQAIRADMGHAQATHPPPELSAEAIQDVDTSLAAVGESIGRQRADEDKRPLKLHDGSTLEEHSLKTDEEVGLCCPMDKIDVHSEDWLSKCRESVDL